MAKPNFTPFLLCFSAVLLYTPQAKSQEILNNVSDDTIISIESELPPEMDDSWVRLISRVERLYTTAGDPFEPIYLVNPGQGFDGVGNIFFTTNNQFQDRCGASLLYSGRHLLTAAHCLTNNLGVISVTDVEARFDLVSGTVSYNIPIDNIAIAPGWDGNLVNGNDLAILTLEEIASPEINRYDLYNQSNEIGQIGTKVGYGRSGTGNQGEVLPVGTKRTGQNLYDADGSLRSALFGGATTTILGYDFDNGLPENDAFGFFFDINNLGLGELEVAAARGDSGSPSFINGQIAGVTSFRETIFAVDESGSLVTPDVNFALDSSFGEFIYETRISAHTEWIDREITKTPEPNIIIGFLGAIASRQIWLLGKGFLSKVLNRAGKSPH
ncbi:MAG: hypothetical protein EA365_04540 [Gloeocapsa sp. DLM2.Bin57]|nr:MAG: hypothetical protein EA365_04540 [Gloeocapsa sp. DLM2.Bin57]